MRIEFRDSSGYAFSADASQVYLYRSPEHDPEAGGDGRGVAVITTCVGDNSRRFLEAAEFERLRALLGQEPPKARRRGILG